MSVIVSAYRTAVVPRGGAFAAYDVHDLAAPVIARLLHDAGLSTDQVGEIIVANAIGEGGNPARRVALAAGLPETVAGLSIDRQCAGGLDALLLADAMIRAGLHDIVIAGGVESYSRRPLRSRVFADGRPPEPYDQAPFTPWTDRDPMMATAAEALAQELGISREDQDLYAVQSHAKALASNPCKEIVAIAGQERDPFARDLSQAHCRRAKVIDGTITAANTAVAADAAAFCLVMSEARAAALGLGGMRITKGLTIGGRPDLPGLAPVAAIERLLTETGLRPDQIDRAEIMEAYAVQAIACIQGAGLPQECVNRNGGALARGHPIGASGAILAVRLFHDLEQGEKGLAAIAAAGGLGTALLVER
ncbi:thiolase family protein [Marivivens sp. LCG002]|uniref:thiolase family protein n=1 Tax=Marivivens sp. LCG002 TaxID=3051171 RepID=UPI0025525907|nr:thiolase family protein [Marivivens sp. LCG002]WIV51446.1 thiolase family protein [Marivivens sp. LCG002]